MEAAGDGPKPDIVTEGYNLTPEEERAVTEPDIGAIYAMGVHPVIVNGFCRALGYKRADYRPLLENSGADPGEEEDPMAEIVMAYSASHAPMMTADPGSAPRRAGRQLLRRPGEGARHAPRRRACRPS